MKIYNCLFRFEDFFEPDEEIDFTSKPIYSFDEATGTLTISGNTGDFHYSSNIAPWITEYGEKIKKVVIEEGGYVIEL